MRFNSARPIKALNRAEQEGLRKLLFPTEQPEVFAESETDDSPDPYRESESAKERKLYPREIETAEPFFGDMIDLEEVRISDKSVVGRTLGKNRVAMTVKNTIYGNNMSDGLFIHELVHVWQYKNGLLSPLSAGLWQLAARAIGQKDKLYNYNVVSAGDPNRKPFREYNFEQQAAIIRDAFLVLVKNKPPMRNEGYKGGNELPNDAVLFELYHLFMYEFQQWHKELQLSRSSSTEEEN